LALCGAVLHARGEVRSEACDAVNEIKRLAFTASRTCVIRSEGALSHALAEALKHGTHSLADALRQWVSGEQARQLEDHITRGPAANARPSSAGFAAISYARRRTWSRSARRSQIRSHARVNDQESNCNGGRLPFGLQARVPPAAANPPLTIRAMRSVISINRRPGVTLFDYPSADDLPLRFIGKLAPAHCYA